MTAPTASDFERIVYRLSGPSDLKISVLAAFDALLAERDALAADAKRWRFVRAVATRAPVSIDILGVHRYGVLWEAPRAMDAQMLDRIVDCAIPADNGRQQTWEVARSVVEAEGRP